MTVHKIFTNRQRLWATEWTRIFFFVKPTAYVEWAQTRSCSALQQCARYQWM